MKSLINEIKTVANILETRSAKKPKLPANIKKKISTELNKKINKQTYFPKIPLSTIFSILEKHGVIAIQEDGTKWSGILMGGVKQTEQVYFDIADSSIKDERGFYTPYSNAMLSMSFYKMPSSGNYEIVTYIS